MLANTVEPLLRQVELLRSRIQRARECGDCAALAELSALAQDCAHVITRAQGHAALWIGVMEPEEADRLGAERVQCELAVLAALCIALAAECRWLGEYDR